MRILAHDPYVTSQIARDLNVELVSLPDLYKQGDYITLHVSLTPETEGLLSREAFGWMKPGVRIVNCARGELIDQAALVDALRQRKIAGAGLDVFTPEPLPPNDPLLCLENVIVTPHWLPATTDVWRATGRAMAEGMLRAAHGHVPENVVNVEVLDRPGFRAKLARFRK